MCLVVVLCLGRSTWVSERLVCEVGLWLNTGSLTGTRLWACYECANDIIGSAGDRGAATEAAVWVPTGQSPMDVGPPWSSSATADSHSGSS